MIRDIKSSSYNTIGSVLLSTGIAAFLIGILSRPLSFWSRDGFYLIPSTPFAIVVGSLFLLAALFLSRFKPGELRLDERGFAYGLLLVFMSDWLTRGYNLFQGPVIRGEIILASLVVFFILKKRFLFLFAILTPASILLLVYAFVSESAGRLLFSDDHATFLYRLSLLRDNFPFIPFYNPFWNGGTDARDFFATGAISVFLVASPLIYLFEIESVYNYIIIFLLFILLPLSVYAAARIEKLNAPGPAIAALFSLTFSLIFYRWALKYGTLGFITTATLIPLNLALTSRLFCQKTKITLYEALFFIVSFSLMLLWTPTGLVFIPAIIIAAVWSARLIRKKYAPTIAIAIILINIPWIALFWSVSSVTTFLNSERPSYSAMHQEEAALLDRGAQEVSPAENPAEDSTAPSVEAPSASSAGASATQFRHKAGEFNRAKSLRILRETAISTNPLILLFALPGVFLLKRKTSRIVFLATAVWLTGLGSIMVIIKPQLELDRMLVILSLIACIPAAAAVQKLLRRVIVTRENPFNIVVACLTGGFLLISPLVSASVVSNRSMVQYDFADDKVSEIGQAIQDYSQGGRVLFSGFVLHELSHGHLAPLAYFTGVPLIASSPVHDKWKYEQIFPKYFLERGHRGILEYLDLYNVGAVIAHESYWRRYFQRRPEDFHKEWRRGKFVLFTNLNFKGNYFLQGEGQIIEQNTNSVRLKIDSGDAVIKFNYFPFLQSSHCSLSREEIAPTVNFIRLSDCPADTDITISSRPGYTRIFQSQ